LKISQTIEELRGEGELNLDNVARMVRHESVSSDFGLKFLLESQKDLVLSSDVIDAVFKAICNIALKQQQQPTEIPTAPEDADEETKAKIAEEAERIKAENDGLTERNQKIAQIQHKISIKQVETPYDVSQEQALLRFNNHKDAAAADPNITSARDSPAEDGVEQF